MFTKGQTVHLITSWNDLNVFRIRKAIVHSCGKKQMVLNNENGVCIGRYFAPGEQQSNLGICVTGITDEQAERIALAQAQKYIEKQIAHCEERLVRFADAGEDYLSVMRQKLAEARAAQPEIFWGQTTRSGR